MNRKAKKSFNSVKIAVSIFALVVFVALMYMFAVYTETIVTPIWGVFMFIWAIAGNDDSEEFG